MRVAVVLPRGNLYCMHRPDSIETVVRTLLAHSRDRRAVTVICDEGALLPSEGQVIAVPAGLSRARRTAAVAKVLRRLQPDVIEHHQQLERSADLARQFPRTANIFYRHTRMNRPKRALDALRYHRRLAVFDRLVFVSQATAAEFSADYPASARRVTTVSNPIEIAGWHADVEAKDPLILFSGRAMPDKGFDLICAALERALDAAPTWRATLMLADWHIHKDWAQPHLRLLERFGERVSVRCNAPLSEVRVATRRAAIALTPSRVREGLTLSALEAHAAGAALISSGRGGLSEASGPHAVYIDPDEPSALSEALIHLIHDPERRLALAKAGQEHVVRMHSPSARAVELDGLRFGLVHTPLTARWPQWASLLGARFSAQGASGRPSYSLTK